jgi:hypothetical protein
VSRGNTSKTQFKDEIIPRLKTVRKERIGHTEVPPSSFIENRSVPKPKVDRQETQTRQRHRCIQHFSPIGVLTRLRLDTSGFWTYAVTQKLYDVILCAIIGRSFEMFGARRLWLWARSCSIPFSNDRMVASNTAVLLFQEPREF